MKMRTITRIEGLSFGWRVHFCCGHSYGSASVNGLRVGAEAHCAQCERQPDERFGSGEREEVDDGWALGRGKS